MPSKALFFTLLLAWVALFQFLGNSTLGYIPSRSLLNWMFRSYTPYPPLVTETFHQVPVESPDAHGNLIPFLVLVLFWWKRKELLKADFRNWWPGLFLVAAGLVLHFFGFALQQPRISVVGMFTGLYGLMGLAWGPDWLRKSFFPYCLFIFSVPAGSLAEPFTFRLRLLVSMLVEAIAYVIPFGVVREGTKLIDAAGRYEYEVAAACSGIRSLAATLALALVLGVLSFRSWWKRLVMLLAAIPLAVAGNLLRMLAIVIAAEMGGREWGAFVHDGGPGGVFTLLLYIPAFLGLLWLEGRLHRLGRPEPKEPTQPAVPPAADSHRAGEAIAFPE